MNNKYKPLVSIIMPVYNDAKYLPDTLDSIRKQVMTDFEVICVDDGSVDNSAEIIKSVSIIDNRFHYIYQNNSGAGEARNKGLQNANGRYIAFIDGDDMYCPDFLEKMISIIQKTEADICSCEMLTYDDKYQKVVNTSDHYSKFIANKKYYVKDLLPTYFLDVTLTCWDKIFNHAFLKKYNFKFQNLKSSNDVCFVYSCLAAANTIAFTNKALIKYRVNTGTSTQDTNHKNPLCGLMAYDATRNNVLELHNNEAIWEKSINNRCIRAFLNSFESMAHNHQKAKEVYDAYKTIYAPKWNVEEIKGSYIVVKDLRFKYWCYRNTSFEGLLWAYGFRHKNLRATKGKRNIIANMIFLYAGIFHK